MNLKSCSNHGVVTLLVAAMAVSLFVLDTQLTPILAAENPGGSVEGDSKVILTENAKDESAGGLECFKIETSSATYFLEKTGGGLSSMIDPDGNDWISFHPLKGSRAGGEFRGFPNAAYKQGGNYFHPLNSGTDPSVSKVVYVSSEKVSIASESKDGLWACRYDFYSSHCDFIMTKMPDDKRYWVLYEGTPGGEFDSTDYWLSSGRAEPVSIMEKNEEDLPDPEWIAFGDLQSPYYIFLRNHEGDSHPDNYFPMEDSMTVFGFGRDTLEHFFDKTGQLFSIGLVKKEDVENLGEAILRITTLD